MKILNRQSEFETLRHHFNKCQDTEDARLPTRGSAQARGCMAGGSGAVGGSYPKCARGGQARWSLAATETINH
jgi:hypothetical protein